MLINDGLKFKAMVYMMDHDDYYWLIHDWNLSRQLVAREWQATMKNGDFP